MAEEGDAKLDCLRMYREGLFDQFIVDARRIRELLQAEADAGALASVAHNMCVDCQQWLDSPALPASHLSLDDLAISRDSRAQHEKELSGPVRIVSEEQFGMIQGFFDRQDLRRKLPAHAARLVNASSIRAEARPGAGANEPESPMVILYGQAVPLVTGVWEELAAIWTRIVLEGTSPEAKNAALQLLAQSR